MIRNFNVKRILAAFIAALSLTACGNAGEQAVTEETTAAETAALEETEPADPYTAMVQRSLVSLGNTHRMKQKLEAMAKGEEVTAAFLGGSITEGYTVQPEECWAKLTYDYFCEKYPNATINYVNAGLSGTPSILGNLRAERDVISKEADIVFIEYAVNDGNDKLYQESYDSLVKTVLEQENEPAVVLLFNRTKEGHTAQDYMKQIGEHYDLPMISTADALTPSLEEGTIKWENYYNDSSHPSPDGHKLFEEFIGYYFSELEKVPDDGEYAVPVIGKFGAPYENAVMIEADSEGVIESLGSFDKSASVSGFTKGWAYNGSGSDEPMKLKITGKDRKSVV